MVAARSGPGLTALPVALATLALPPVRSLPAGGLAAAVDPDTARDQARRILDGDKYQEQRLPRPFKGVLEWLADLFRPLVDAFDKVVGGLFRFILGLPGGSAILLALALGAAVAAAWWLASRRSRSAVTGAGGAGLVDLAADPAALDREAEAAEAAGDLALAVRRRYEAGLLRLVRAERLVLRADTTAEAAARQVADPAMDRLTTDFEEVTYGGRSATAADVERARSGWLEVLGAGARR